MHFGFGLNELSKDYDDEYRNYNMITGSQLSDTGYDNNVSGIHTYAQYLIRNADTNNRGMYFKSAKFYIDPGEADGNYKILPALIQVNPLAMKYTNGSSIVDTKPGTPQLLPVSQLNSSNSIVAQSALFNIVIDGSSADDVHESSGLDFYNETK